MMSTKNMGFLWSLVLPLILTGVMGDDQTWIRVTKSGMVPSESSVIRVRRPQRPNPTVVTPLIRESSILRIRPILIATDTESKSLERTLGDMGHRRMAALIHTTQLQPFLQKAGKVTLLAPTDEAFSLQPPPRDMRKLREFVLRHVANATLTPSSARNDVTVPSLTSSGTPLRINVYDDGQVVSVSGAQLLDGARNFGQLRIQPVDRVLRHVSDNDLVSEIKSDFPSMFALVLRSSLTPQLSSGTFTLFAPTDDGFNGLKPEIRKELMNNPTLMRRVVLNHIVPGSHYTSSMSDGSVLRSLGGDQLHFNSQRGIILVNGVPIIKGDVSARNGVLHVINRVLLPPELKPGSTPAVSIAPPAPDSRNGHADPKEPTYIEPPPQRSRTVMQTMNTPLFMPGGRRHTFTTANSLFRRSQLLNQVPGGPGYTVLLPTDEAFAALGPRAVDSLRRNSRQRRRLLVRHIVPGTVDWNSPNSAQTMGGRPINFHSTENGKVLRVGDAKVISVRPASDGAVFVTDRVLLPKDEESRPPPPSSPLADVLANQTRLHGKPTFTIFAPTNDALAVLPPALRDDRQAMAELLMSHMVRGLYDGPKLTNGTKLTTVNGHVLNIGRTPDGILLVNNQPIADQEIISENVILYPINTLLVPPSSLTTTTAKPEIEDPRKSIQDIAQKHGATRFMQWMRDAGLQRLPGELASRNGACTLFMPTDSALKSMSPTLRTVILGDPGRLEKFLLFHMSPDPLNPGSVSDNSVQVSLLPGKGIRRNVVSKPEPRILVSGCKVSAVEKSADNVTVVVLEDGAMTPPVGDLTLSTAKSPLLRNFSKILTVADAADIFKDGPYTLFAPDSCAFASMPAEEYQNLITNKKHAREFVLRHAVKGCLYSGAMRNGETVFSLAGTPLHIQVTPECIIVNNAKILYGDMTANNGVIHIISSILA